MLPDGGGLKGGGGDDREQAVVDTDDIAPVGTGGDAPLGDGRVGQDIRSAATSLPKNDSWQRYRPGAIARSSGWQVCSP